MNFIYTLEGWPLQIDQNHVFNSRGRQVALLQGGRAFGPNGRYVGTLDDDRLVYRPTDSVALGPVYAPMIGSPFAVVRQVKAALLGLSPRSSTRAQFVAPAQGRGASTFRW